MSRFVTWAGVFVVGIALWMPSRAAAGQEPSSEARTYYLAAPEPVATPPQPWVGRVVGIPGPDIVEKSGAAGIPTFTRTVVARGRTYRYTMVGSDPFAPNARSVSVPLFIVPVRFEFDDGSVFDPTELGTACAGSDTPLNLALQSPVLRDFDYGDGSRQYIEQFRRLEFWSQTGRAGAINPGYSVRVSPTVLPAIRVVLTGFPTKAAPCGRIGMIDHVTWDTLVKTKLFPQLRRQGVSIHTFPLFLFTNVVMYDRNPTKCCLFGYHTWFNSGGVQTYGVAGYDTSRNFAGSDVSTLSHELGEWYDDPLVHNPTPPWGHTGQVSGCQPNLEVGDPLSGHEHAIAMPNGLTYHPQELAFFSWFYNQVPSLGFDGWYSSGGTFRTPASPCR